MESVEPVRAGEMSVVVSADFLPAGLRANGVRGEKRVPIGHSAQDPGWIDRTVRIQGDAVVFFNRQSLKAIHVVSDRRSVAVIEVEIVIPRGASGAAARKKARIGVKTGFVAAGSEVPQDVALGVRGALEERQHAVAIACKNDFVKIEARSIHEIQRHVGPGAADGSEIGRKMNAIAERCGHWSEIRVAAAADGPPLQVARDAEHAVIGEEPYQGLRRERANGA